MRKTKYLVGTFLATALLIGGCSDSENVEENPAPAENSQTQKLAGQRLTDDNGMEYTLIDNGDGTETARYDDGRSVTFQRQEDGSLNYLAGAAGLIAGMAAGYYLFHGFSRPAGTWNSSTNRYMISEPLRRENTSGTYTSRPASSANSSTPNSSTATNSNSKVNLSKESAPSSAATSSNSKVNLSKESTSSSSAKSGFGGAGARTSAAS